MLEDLPMPTMRDFGMQSPGHEGAAVVVALGSNVKNWRVGDRAGVKPACDACFNCELRWSMLETRCPQSSQTGLQHPGTCQQCIVTPARYTARIPDGVDQCFNLYSILIRVIEY